MLSCVHLSGAFSPGAEKNTTGLELRAETAESFGAASVRGSSQAWGPVAWALPACEHRTQCESRPIPYPSLPYTYPSSYRRAAGRQPIKYPDFSNIILCCILKIFCKYLFSVARILLYVLQLGPACLASARVSKCKQGLYKSSFYTLISSISVLDSEVLACQLFQFRWRGQLSPHGTTPLPDLGATGSLP